jgi:hypothetical protein
MDEIRQFEAQLKTLETTWLVETLTLITFHRTKARYLSEIKNSRKNEAKTVNSTPMFKSF